MCIETSLEKLMVDTSPGCDDCSGDTSDCKVAESSIILISIFSSVACLIDLFTVGGERHMAKCTMKEYLDSMRLVLVALFQLANVCLLVATLIESSSLVNVYVSSTLGFVLLGLVLALLELLERARRAGAASALLHFLPEVVFMFVISRCLPMVNSYRKYLFSSRK